MDASNERSRKGSPAEIAQDHLCAMNLLLKFSRGSHFWVKK